MLTLFLIIIYLAFIIIGLPNSLLGSAWPSMQPDLVVGLSSAGVIFTIISFETVISSLFSGKLITDTKVALADINKRTLKELNCNALCYVSDEKVAEMAKARHITRSMAAVEKAVEDGFELFIFGNASTALFRLKELIEEVKCNAKFILAALICFVGAAGSKIAF